MLHFNKNDIPPTVAEMMARNREEGMEEGIKEGIKKGGFDERKTLARSMITRGYSNEEITELLPLSLEEIENLRLMQ